MRKLLAIVVFSAYAIAGTDSSLPANIHDALMPLDSLLPTQQDLATVYSTKQNAVTGLQMIASDVNSEVGVRLRAIRSLSQYSSAQVGGSTAGHDTLASLVDTNRNASVGSDLLVLRAAIEALGAHPDKNPSDLGMLADNGPLRQSLLSHQSRDIRVATARALRDLGNTSAIPYLRERYAVEPLAQVRLAISEALRVLGSPTQ
jgi:HEAT repeat protein